MPDRRSMTARLVPLTSREAADPPAGASADERLGMLRALSALAWELSGRPSGPDLRTAPVGMLRPLRAPVAP